MVAVVISSADTSIMLWKGYVGIQMKQEILRGVFDVQSGRVRRHVLQHARIIAHRIVPRLRPGLDSSCSGSHRSGPVLAVPLPSLG